MTGPNESSSHMEFINIEKTSGNTKDEVISPLNADDDYIISGSYILVKNKEKTVTYEVDVAKKYYWKGIIEVVHVTGPHSILTSSIDDQFSSINSSNIFDSQINLHHHLKNHEKEEVYRKLIKSIMCEEPFKLKMDSYQNRETYNLKENIDDTPVDEAIPIKDMITINTSFSQNIKLEEPICTSESETSHVNNIYGTLDDEAFPTESMGTHDDNFMDTSTFQNIKLEEPICTSESETSHVNNIYGTLDDEAFPTESMGTHDDNFMYTSTIQNIKLEGPYCISKSETHSAKQIKVLSHHTSHKEKFLKNVGLVSMCIYNRTKKKVEQRERSGSFRRRYLFRARSPFDKKKNVNNNPYMCKACEVHFNNATLLNNHITSGCKDMVCTFCKATFTTINKWSKHVNYRRYHYRCMDTKFKVNKANVVDHNKNVKNTSSSIFINKKIFCSNVTEKKMPHCSSRYINTTMKEEPVDVDSDIVYSADGYSTNVECTICDLLLPNIHSLALHMATHKEYSMHKCMVCHESFKKINPWKNHMMYHQQQLNLIMSKSDPNLAEFTLNSNASEKFHAHLENLNNQQCFKTTEKPESPKYSQTVFATNLNRTQKPIHLNENKLSETLEKSKIDLVSTEHVKRKEKNTTTFSCDICNKKFTKKFNLARHLKCGHQVSTSPIVSNQLLKDSSNFKGSGSIKESQKTIQVENPNDSSNITIAIVEERSKRQCNFCEKQYVYVKNLNRHVRFHHSGVNMPYKCQHCSKTFETKNCLTNHVKFHNYPLNKEQLPPQICENPEFMCNTSLQTNDSEQCSSSVKPAMDNMVQIPTPYICKICNMAFTTLQIGLKNHLKVHLSKKEYEEFLLNNQQVNQSTLLEETMDVKPIPMNCVFCNTTYCGLSNFQQHLDTTHSTKGKTYYYTSDINGFHCRECGKCFIRKGNFLRHHLFNHFIDNSQC